MLTTALLLPLLLTAQASPEVASPSTISDSREYILTLQDYLGPNEPDSDAVRQARLAAIEESRGDHQGYNSQLTGDHKAELMLRVSDLYYQEGQDLLLRGMPHEEAATWFEKAITINTNLLSTYPTYARADDANIRLADALWAIGRTNEAVNEYTRLVKIYPESVHVPTAYVMIGEYYFDSGNAYKALLAYKKSSAYRDAAPFLYAQYKLAWCFYNVGEYPEALSTLTQVIDYPTQEPETSRRGFWRRKASTPADPTALLKAQASADQPRFAEAAVR